MRRNFEKKLRDCLKISCKLESNCARPITDFGKLEIKSFEKAKVGQLKGFIAVRLASNLTELKSKIKLMPNKKFPNKGSAELASLGDFNLISKAFELKAKSPSFEVVELLEIESEFQEIATNLGPIIAEASSIRNDFCSDKSKKLLSSK